MFANEIKVSILLIVGPCLHGKRVTAKHTTNNAPEPATSPLPSETFFSLWDTYQIRLYWAFWACLQLASQSTMSFLWLHPGSQCFDDTVFIAFHQSLTGKDALANLLLYQILLLQDIISSTRCPLCHLPICKRNEIQRMIYLIIMVGCHVLAHEYLCMCRAAGPFIQCNVHVNMNGRCADLNSLQLNNIGNYCHRDDIPFASLAEGLW